MPSAFSGRLCVRYVASSVDAAGRDCPLLAKLARHFATLPAEDRPAISSSIPPDRQSSATPRGMPGRPTRELSVVRRALIHMQTTCAD